MFEILKRFFDFCDKENRNKFYGSIAVGVVNSMFTALRIAAVAVMLTGVIDTIVSGNDFNSRTIFVSLGIMLASVLGGVLTKKEMSMWQTEGGYRTCAKKRIEIAEHLRYVPMGYFNKNSLGKITSVTTNTMELLGDIATRAVMMVLQGLLDSALIIVMIMIFDIRIGLVALAGFLLFEFVNAFMRLAVKKVSEEKNASDTAQVEKILEYIQGISEVRSYNLVGKQSKELNHVIDWAKRTCISMELRCIPISAIQSFVAKMTGVAIMLSSIFFFLGGTMILSNCAVMLVCSFMLFSALEAGGNYSALLRSIDIAVKKAKEILDIPTMDIDGDEISLDKNKAEDLELKAENVKFSYGKKQIINGISLEIPAKTTVAIVGPSGSGKTTFCHLLSRFWDVDSGLVTLGGNDVKDFSMDSLMSNFTFVFQDVYLFHDTIANNIRFGNPNATMEQVTEAAKKACCHDFIQALPNGYETVIGEGGASLSGGERQRLSIARAIIKDAPIIILDEATANVDPENERDLIQAIHELTKEKTVIMIAHRLKTVRNADKIIVLDEGRIAEEGTHEELLKIGGIYSRFIQSRKEAVSWKI